MVALLWIFACFVLGPGPVRFKAFGSVFPPLADLRPAEMNVGACRSLLDACDTLYSHCCAGWAIEMTEPALDELIYPQRF